MWLKVIIVALLVAIVASLFSGAAFLTRNTGSGRWLLTALTLRISLTVLLLALVVWGLWSGQLRWGAPWLH